MSSHNAATIHPSFMGKPVITAEPMPVNKVSPMAEKKSSKTDLAGARARKGIKESSRTLCPHCDFPALTRTSTQLSKLVKRSMHSCTNPECGHTFVTHQEIVRTLSPSATPDPSVLLPLSSHVRRDLLRATLENASESEHSTQFTKPVNGDLFAGGPPTD